jgi:hypothetical protein
MPKLELIVQEALEDGRLVVTNNSREDIPVSTVFFGAFWAYSEVLNGEFINEQNGSIGSVELRIDESEWFRREIDCVPSGHQAAVRFSGFGLEMVIQNVAGKRRGVQIMLSTERVDK